MSEARDYRIQFKGRLRGAIGSHGPCLVTVMAASDKDAVAMLYEIGYEHVIWPMEIMPDGTARGPLPY